MRLLLLWEFSWRHPARGGGAMSDWIDKLREQQQFNQLEKEMGMEEIRLAKEAAPSTMDALLKQIEKDVHYFRTTFPHSRMFKGPTPMSNGVWLLATETFPAYNLQYEVSNTSLLFERLTWKTPESAKQKTSGVIQLKAAISGGVWFDYQGEKMLHVEDVSRFILEPFFEHLPK